MTRLPASSPARAPGSSGAGRARARALAERVFWLAGLLCVGVAGTTMVESYAYQRAESEAFDRELEFQALETEALARTVPASEEPLGFPPSSAPDRQPAPVLMGRLEVPRLGIEAMVREGVDDETLKVAVGHIPGTARPGEIGNIGLAAHRDTFFRALRNVRKGDVLRLTTLDGSETYRVASATVVDPDQVGVLSAKNDTRSLTLVTCFPFNYIGAAPKRFVVAALADEGREKILRKE